jgi:hypothetical protein
MEPPGIEGGSFRQSRGSRLRNLFRVLDRLAKEITGIEAGLRRLGTDHPYVLIKMSTSGIACPRALVGVEDSAALEPVVVEGGAVIGAATLILLGVRVGIGAIVGTRAVVVTGIRAGAVVRQSRLLKVGGVSPRVTGT